MSFRSSFDNRANQQQKKAIYYRPMVWLIGGFSTLFVISTVDNQPQDKIALVTLSYETANETIGDISIYNQPNDDNTAGQISLPSTATVIEQTSIAASAPNIQLVAPNNLSHSVGDTVLERLKVSPGIDSIIIFTASNLPKGLEIDKNGLIHGTLETEAGEYPVSVTAVDGLHQTQSNINFIWTIKPKNNLPPVFIAMPIKTAIANSQYQLQTLASDANHDQLNYRLLESPVGMTIDAATGLINWKPSSTQIGENIVSLVVSDNLLQDKLTFSLQVAAQDTTYSAPELFSQPSKMASIGQQYTYQLLANDLNGDSLKIELIFPPAGMSINDEQLLTWTPTAEQAGSHQIILSIEDQHYQISQNFILDVADMSSFDMAP